MDSLSFNVNGIPMSDFVYPAYFEVFHKPGSVKFDQLNKVTRPFQILSGGYQIVFKNGKWGQVHGSVSQKRKFALEDRREHRSEIRKKKKREKADVKEIARLQRRA